MESKLENRMIFLNEIVVSIYLYILMVLTDFFAEINLFRENCGWALVLVILTAFSLNFSKFLILFAKSIYLKVQRCNLKK